MQVLHGQNDLTKIHLDIFFLELDLLLSAQVEKQLPAWVVV